MNIERRLTVFSVLLAACRAASGGEWKASVVKSVDALVASCVVLPCSFSHPKEQLPTSRLRGIWHYEAQKDQRIYHQDNTNVLASFRDRTRLLGHLGQGDCSLEITKVKDYDNGPFCFRIELARTEGDASTPDKFSFVENCVKLKMLPDPPKPMLIHANKAFEGRLYTAICSVTHTCPTHAPSLTWSKEDSHDVTTVIREIHAGSWEVQSILAFVPQATDDHRDITCTANFYGRMSSSDNFTLFVKRSENHHHIIIPTVVALVIAVLFGGLCIVMVKKYKRRIAELQGQPSWRNRLSRLSRRRPRENMVDLNHLPSTSTATSSAAGQKFWKTHRPTPKMCQPAEALSAPHGKENKNQPKVWNYKQDVSDDDYENTADLNVYRNR
ncbi:myelin-associated glycoprotein-like isoform X2 [Phyllopteryx taeniolatus]|uniref:myelin-associated glycoprotein-like isoform X2 n=1 Tax=Phyllopteryx taeniolatus TaxID=161469 RepID=UPI002AD4D21C|nr:myelin-associated glycoprotein-like isoform X2 [Phyllopteryx taeniolatus]